MTSCPGSFGSFYEKIPSIPCIAEPGRDILTAAGMPAYTGGVAKKTIFFGFPLTGQKR